MTASRSTAIPCLRYRDAKGAIAWLCDVIGFQRHQVFEGPNNTIAHAELTLGGGMIMLGSINDTPFNKFCRQPDEIGGYQTQSPYVVVPDADAVYNRGKNLGAIIAIEIKDESYGGRGFSMFDPEGHLWNIGTYDPWSHV
jgi:uncharacterized glyoxalase superfamily protein PhnB